MSCDLISFGGILWPFFPAANGAMLSVVSLSGEHILQLNIDKLTVAEPHAAAVNVIKQCIRSEKHISIFRHKRMGWICGGCGI